MARTIYIHAEQITEWAARIVQAQEQGDLEYRHTQKEWETALSSAIADWINWMDVDLMDNLFGPRPFLRVDPRYICDMPDCYRERPWDEPLCSYHKAEEAKHLSDTDPYQEELDRCEDIPTGL